MQITDLLTHYESGPELLHAAVRRAREDQFDRVPIVGQWSIRQLVCHVADFELVYADRLKRVLAEDNPTLFSGDPDAFARALQYDRRNVSEELEIIRLIRQQTVRILRETPLEHFQRTGVHSEAGPLTLETLLERIAGHIPHHVRFVDQKIAAMG